MKTSEGNVNCFFRKGGEGKTPHFLNVFFQQKPSKANSHFPLERRSSSS